MFPGVHRKYFKTRDMVVYVVTHHPGLSAKKIFALVIHVFTISVTYQAIHKLLKLLVEEHILIETENQYYVSKEWIDYLKQYTCAADGVYHHEDIQRKVGDIITNVVDEKNLNLQVSKMRHVLDFLYEFEEQYVMRYNNENVVVGKFVHNFAFIRAQGRNYHLKKFYLCRGNDMLDNLSLFHDSDQNNFMRTGVESVDENIFVYGDFVIQVFFEDHTLTNMEKLFDEVRGLEDLNMRKFDDFLDSRNVILLNVIYNSMLANHYRDAMLKRFGMAFNGLLTSLSDQNAEMKKIPSQYYYLTPCQKNYYEKIVEVKEDVIEKETYDAIVEQISKLFQKSTYKRVRVIHVGYETALSDALLESLRHELQKVDCIVVDVSNQETNEEYKRLKNIYGRMQIEYMRTNIDTFLCDYYVHDEQSLDIICFNGLSFSFEYKETIQKWLDIVKKKACVVVGACFKEGVDQEHNESIKKMGETFYQRMFKEIGFDDEYVTLRYVETKKQINILGKYLFIPNYIERIFPKFPLVVDEEVKVAEINFFSKEDIADLDETFVAYDYPAKYQDYMSFVLYNKKLLNVSVLDEKEEDSR